MRSATRTLVPAVVAIGALMLAVPSISSATGNGAPSGGHYTLNIIGVSNPKTAPMDNSDRHTIFVPEKGGCQISLVVGEFNVNDGNCFDGDGAEFQLPNPDPDNTGTTTYSVFARALGTPGGSSQTTTCATDPDTGEEVCSVISLELTRQTGQTQFKNASKCLLYIYADLNGDGTTERYNLFNSALTDYFWWYDNNYLKLAQLRFYQTSTTVPDGATPGGNC
jgi:hypothetical protein